MNKTNAMAVFNRHLDEATENGFRRIVKITDKSAMRAEIRQIITEWYTCGYEAAEMLHAVDTKCIRRDIPLLGSWVSMLDKLGRK